MRGLRLIQWLAGLLATLFIIPLVAKAVELIAEKYGWDKALADWLESAMSSIAWLAEFKVVWLGAGFFAGIALALWLQKRLSPLGAPTSEESANQLLSDQLAELREAYDRYAKPRELTADQIKTISDFLLPRSSHTVRIYCAPTNEANSYAGQIYQGFKGADWDIPAKGIEPISALQTGHLMHEGMGVYAALPKGQSSAGKPYDLAMEALTKASVAYQGAGSILSKTDQEYVVIVVGPRQTR
jgi:hypothetical protein